jgi:hypothetical protein
MLRTSTPAEKEYLVERLKVRELAAPGFDSSSDAPPVLD